MEKQPKYLTDKRGIGDKFGMKNLISKKPVKNPKYDNIKSTVDTGKSVKGIVMESDQLVSKRKSELFRRIKGGAIIKLISENLISESIYNLAKEEEAIQNEPNINNDDKSVVTAKSQVTAVTSVTHSSQIVGDLSKITHYIIIDLREVEEFEQFRIKEAVSMPYFNISRDKYPNEMYLIRNNPNKMIIVYSLDERHSIPHCQLLVQKGFDNICMLTGGIEEFVRKYPDYCEGVGMAKILIEIQKKENEEKELMSKSRYKHTSSKAQSQQGDELKNGEMKDKAVSSKMSVVSGVSQVSGKSGVSITALKANLAKK